MVSYKYGGLIFICLIVGSIYFQIDSQKPEPPPKPMPEETIVVVGTCLEDHVLPKFTRKFAGTITRSLSGSDLFTYGHVYAGESMKTLLGYKFEDDPFDPHSLVDMTFQMRGKKYLPPTSVEFPPYGGIKKASLLEDSFAIKGMVKHFAGVDDKGNSYYATYHATCELQVVKRFTEKPKTLQVGLAIKNYIE